MPRKKPETEEERRARVKRISREIRAFLECFREERRKRAEELERRR